jgi:hypothetical protein
MNDVEKTTPKVDSINQKRACLEEVDKETAQIAEVDIQICEWTVDQERHAGLRQAEGVVELEPDLERIRWDILQTLGAVLSACHHPQ